MIEQLITFFIPALLGVWLFFKSPLKLMILYPAFLFLKIGIGTGATIMYAIDVFHLLMGLYVIDALLRGKPRLQLDGGGRLIVLFFLLFVTNIILDRNHDTPRMLYENFFIFIAFIYFSLVVSKQNIDTAVKYFMYSKCILVGLAVLFFLFPSFFPTVLSVSFGIQESDSFLRFSMLQQASFLFIYAVVFISGRKLYLLALLLFALVVVSGSRTHLIICVGIFLYNTLLNVVYSENKKSVFRIVFFVILIGGLATVFMDTIMSSKYFMRYEQLVTNPVAAGGSREHYFANSWSVSKDNLLFGNEIKDPKQLRNNYGIEWIHVYTGRTHNVYLAILYAFGIPGLLIMLRMVYLYFRQSIRSYRIRTAKSVQFLHLLLVAAVVEGISAGSYFSLIAESTIIAMIMVGTRKEAPVVQRQNTPQNA